MRDHFRRRVGVVVLLVFLGSCSPVSNLNDGSWTDAQAPTLLEQRTDQTGRVELEFDEEVELAPGSLRTSADTLPKPIEPTAPPHKAKKTIALDTAPKSKPGQAYTMAVQAKNKSGNATQVIVPYYGANPRLPKVLINELNTKSSAKMRDTVELRVMGDGDLAGLTLYLGTPENNDGFFTFAALEVKAGDYLLIHCKPEGLANETDEYNSISAASGKQADPTTRDFWLRGGSGLPDTNGVICLNANPIGQVVDAVFYGDKTTEDGKKYDSFGTKKLQERVNWIVKQQAWTIAQTKPRVEDAVPSKAVSATRTLCRNVSGSDSNSLSDWHVVPSGKSTLGAANSPEVFQP